MLRNIRRGVWVLIVALVLAIPPSAHAVAAPSVENTDFMHARYYSPNLGRFVSVDPIGGKVGSSQSWNRYSYVRNSPLGLTDIDGRLERDINGNLVFRSGPVQNMYFEKEGGLRYSVEVGALRTNKGRSVQAVSAIPTREGSRAGEIRNPVNGAVVGYKPDATNPAATNCHGTTFAEGKFSIDPSQVDTILADDGWQKQEGGSAAIGDILIYRDSAGTPAHSVTVTGVSESGQVTSVSGLNGPETEVNETTAEEAWDTTSHTVERYRVASQ